MPRQFNVTSVDFVNFDLSTRQFDVKLHGLFAGSDDGDSIELEDYGGAEDLNVIRDVLSKLPAAYRNSAPIAFSLTLDDGGEVLVPTGPIAKASNVHPVNVNMADATTLETVPGIGPAIANLIIAKRPFKPPWASQSPSVARTPIAL
jgi:hypothetical protein